MSDPLGQDSRIARFETPLGKDRLTLISFECSEGVSEIYEIRADVLGGEQKVDFDGLIGQNCTIVYKTAEHGERHFDGILTEARRIGRIDRRLRYNLVLKPWFWLLSFRRNCRIFHELSAPDIIAQIFADHGFAKFEMSLSRSYPVLEYCVQYLETDMDFVCRLMEQHGICYYFTHELMSHSLIVSDEAPSFKTVPGGSRRFAPDGGLRYGEVEHFDDWIPERRFTSGKVKLDDYDFKKPSASLMVDKEGDAGYEHGQLEYYDYPGKYFEQSDGRAYVEARLNAERSRDGHVFARGNAVSLFSGCHVTLKDHPDSAENEEYLVLRCIHAFTGEQQYRSGGGADAAGGQPAYDGRYELVRSDRSFAPPARTAKPRIHGVQTALVVGKSSNSDGEIDVDEYGRIMVQFYWDQDEGHSMACRVAQVWSGSNWGGIYIPRIGMEVVVQFLEGDPDRPLVIGTVYNQENMPPYDLPGERTKAGVKSETEYGGGYNEFIFDDKGGSELIRMHAQRDLEAKVLNDETRDIGMDRETTIGNDDTLHVGNILSIDAGTKVEITVGASKITMTTSKITIESLEIEINAQHFSSTAVLSEHSGAAVMDIKGGVVKINS